MENLIKKHNERMKQLDLSIVSGSLSDDDAEAIDSDGFHIKDDSGHINVYSTAYLKVV